jgi:predicted dehydrogenase
MGKTMQKGVIIGVGNMGRHHLRVCRELGLDIIACDSNVDNIYLKNEKNIIRDYKKIDVSNIDFVIIATPTKTHYEILKYFAEKNIFILIEKPIFDIHDDLSEFFHYRNRIMVGHIEQFNPVICTLKGLLGNKEIIACNFKRVGFFPTQIDVDILIDFAIHDINNSLYLFGFPKNYYCTGIKNNDVLGILTYKNGLNVLIQASWNTPYKMREIEVICRNGVFKGDLINQELLLESNDFRINYKINKVEPLKLELEYFINSIKHTGSLANSYENGIDTLKIAKYLKYSSKYNSVV